MYRPIAFCLFVGFLVCGAGSTAQPPVPDGAADILRPDSLIYIPYEKSMGPDLGMDKSILLPYAEFLRLRAAPPEATDGTTPSLAALAQASFIGRVAGDVAVFEVRYQLSALVPEGRRVELELPFSGVAIERVRLREPAVVTSAARPLGRPRTEMQSAVVAPRTDGTSGLRLIFDRSGQYELALTLVAPIQSSGLDRRLDFLAPAAAGAEFRLTTDGPVTLAPNDWPQHSAPLLPARLEEGADGTATIVASAGGRERLALAYRSRVDAVGEAVVERLAIDHAMRMTVMPGMSELRDRISVQPLAGETRSLDLVLTSGARLVRVTGPYIQEWTAPDDEGRFTVTFAEPMAQPFVLDLDIQATSGATLDLRSMVDAAAPSQEDRIVEVAGGEGRLVVPSVRVPGAARETGRLDLTPQAGLSLWVEAADGLEAVAPSDGAATGARAFRFAHSDWSLTLSTQAIPARLFVQSILVYEARDESIELHTRHNLTVHGRSVFGLRLTAPDGYTLYSYVEDGPTGIVAGHRQQGPNVELYFSPELKDSLGLQLRFRKEGRADEVVLEPVRIVGAEEDAGTVALALPPDVRATEVEARGLKATDARHLADQTRSLAGTRLAPTMGYTYSSPDFRAVLALEKQRARITCETSRLISIQPSLMRVNATLRFNVEFSAVDAFQVLAPAWLGDDLRISGADIKDKTRAPLPLDATDSDLLTTWTVRLQRAMIGPYELSVAFDRPLSEKAPGQAFQADVPVVMAAGVARETGFVAVSRSESIEVRVAESEGLERRDVQEMPAELQSAFLGFRYFDNARQRLVLELIRHEPESVLGAVIHHCYIDTVVSEQGDAVHEAYFVIQNNREQYLELRLPQGPEGEPTMDVWMAFVRGTPVRPTIRRSDGACLIELNPTMNDGEAPSFEAQNQVFRVRLALRETVAPGGMGRWGQMRFQAPEPLNMPVLKMTRRMFLPRDFRYTGFRGSLLLDGRQEPWMVPAAEATLHNAPARLAGGVAAPSLRPTEITGMMEGQFGETEAERMARLQAGALDVPIVKEGAVFRFTRLNGVGEVTISFWRKRALVIFHIALALVGFALLAVVMAALRRPWIAPMMTFAAFVLAGLTTGMAGRALATLFLAWLAATLFWAAHALWPHATALWLQWRQNRQPATVPDVPLPSGGESAKEKE